MTVVLEPAVFILGDSSPTCGHKCVLCHGIMKSGDSIVMIEYTPRVGGVGASMIPKPWPVHQECADKQKSEIALTEPTIQLPMPEEAPETAQRVSLGPRTNGRCDHCGTTRAHKKDCPVRKHKE